MNQSYKAILSQHALPQFLPTWGGQGGVIWGDLEGCSLKTMMFEKYPSISPYTYCANNPMKFVDPSGGDIWPTSSFNSSAYGEVYRNLQSSGIYNTLVEGYVNSNVKNLYLDYDREKCKERNANGYIQPYYGKNMKGEVKTYKAETYFGGVQTEIGIVKTILHEAIHAKSFLEGTYNSKDHTGFDRQALLKGLMDYNSIFDLGYSFDELEILSWGGLQGSDEFKKYINDIANKNNTTFEQEKAVFNIKYTELVKFCRTNKTEETE